MFSDCGVPRRRRAAGTLPGGAGLASCSRLMPQLRPPPSPARRGSRRSKQLCLQPRSCARARLYVLTLELKAEAAFTYVGSSFRQSRQAMAAVRSLRCSGFFTPVGTSARAPSTAFPLPQSQRVQARWSRELILAAGDAVQGHPCRQGSERCSLDLFIYIHVTCSYWRRMCRRCNT